MITVLAKNKGRYGTVELPERDGRLKDFCIDLGIKQKNCVDIRYAGTGKYRSIDIPLLENTIKSRETDIGELNLLAYLIRRMDDNQVKDYCMRLSENSDDLRVRSIENLINDAYETFELEPTQYYKGDNLNELIAAERKRSAPYQTMNKDIFWEMIDTAKQQSGGDYEVMEQILTERLSRMEPEHIALFYAINEEYIKIANSESVYDVGCVLNDGGLSDDGFMDFRGWLIAQGKDVYMKAIKEPKSITELSLKAKNGGCTWETFNYVAIDAYQTNTGQDIYDADITSEKLKQVKADIASETEIGEDNRQEHVSELSQIMNGGF